MADKSKYNVSSDKNKRTYNGIIFDSAMEMHYYRDVILPGVQREEIAQFELQKTYILQPGFVHNDKKILPIKYVADFYVLYSDGREEVIDIKGMAKSDALIKRKMFWYHYPNINYKWLTYVKKYGGWVEYDNLKKLRREDKKKSK